jgi:hypothetical protein
MTFTDSIAAFFSAPAGQAALAVLIVAIVDLVLGVAAAFRDDTFQLDSVGAWLRKHIAGRVIPIWVLLFVGHFTAGISFGDVPVLLGVGLAAAGLYVAETIGSIMSLWGPAKNREVQAVPQD